MDYSPALLANSANQLRKLFKVENLTAPNMQELLHQTTYIVQHLLDTDFNRLLHILYRIDVEEQKVKEVLLTLEKEEIAEGIAQLIIKREVQKARTRLMYKSI